MVLLLVAALLLLFMSPEALEQQSSIIGLSQMLRQILPLVLAVFITMTSTASASLSLEGKNRWIMCSAPVRAIDIFNSKIAVNLTVICPFVLNTSFFLPALVLLKSFLYNHIHKTAIANYIISYNPKIC
jgi:ABC-2 type transport system permease protein